MEVTVTKKKKVAPLIQHSKMQKEYIRNATHRWNIKSGAVRSGKSYVDVSYIIIKRIRERAKLDGISCILGVSKTSIERNVLKPMREKYTEALVGKINSQNIAMIAGEEVYCIGAAKANQVDAIQGSSMKYCYGDEIAKWNRDVFDMLKSRLDKEYSCFDGACNPESPNHWLKEFIDKKDDFDIYLQEYTIFDNPFLPSSYVDNLCKEYAGTILYERLILGKWVRSEGTIYRLFADACSGTSSNNPYILNEIPKMMKINIGVDFGGNGSFHSFSAVGFGFKYSFLVGLESELVKGGITPDEVEKSFIEFVNKISTKYKDYLPVGGAVFNVYCDNADPLMIQALKVASYRYHLPVYIKNALKKPVRERIELVCRCQGLIMFYVMTWNKNYIKALTEAVYDDREGHEDERLDNSETNKYGSIDTLDSNEYAIEQEYKNILNVLEGGLRLNAR